MAQTRFCRLCSNVMYADVEKYQKEGAWVTYVCRNGNCSGTKERIFDSTLKD